MREPFVPYPAVGRLGVVGDRRTAALVASDGSVQWACLPRFDGAPLFGALLDAARGGAWRLGPARQSLGEQHYQDDGAILVTCWKLPQGELELTDFMLVRDEPSDPADAVHVFVRRLRAVAGQVPCHMRFQPRLDFGDGPPLDGDLGGDVPGTGRLRLSATFPVTRDERGALATFVLAAGQEVCAVLETGANPRAWSLERARAALDETTAYWRRWADRFAYTGNRRRAVLRAAVTMHLLTYAPAGSPVAAATTSVPECIGGSWNADYRFSWVRDASLCLSVLARLGDVESARKYIDWLASLRSAEGPPLQVLYRVDGQRSAKPQAREGLEGYRRSRPVRFGNHAFRQRQVDAFGFLGDCLLEYLEHGGEWNSDWWPLLQSIVDFVARSWREPGNGIWELSEPSQFVSSRVMTWVALARIATVARRLGRESAAAACEPLMREIHADVIEQGFSPELGAFRQRYGADTLDAAALLIPLTGFLPASDPRVRGTISRIAEALATDDFVYRFDPAQTPGVQGQLGEFEGAFVPCTCWLAHAYARLGQPDRADAILDRIDALAAPLGLFAEGIDPRDRTWLGNTPLLFSHAAYVLAALAIDEARQRTRREPATTNE